MIIKDDNYWNRIVALSVAEHLSQMPDTPSRVAAIVVNAGEGLLVRREFGDDPDSMLVLTRRLPPDLDVEVLLIAFEPDGDLGASALLERLGRIAFRCAIIYHDSRPELFLYTFRDTAPS